jgi:hypothetical protein
MRFHSVQISNYKSFRDSGEVVLSPGFNVVVGKNDAGKSAFAEALNLRFQNKPHRSIATAPEPDSLLDGASRIRAEIELSPDDLESALAKQQTIIFRRNECEDYDAALAQLRVLLKDDQLFIGEWTSGTLQRGWLPSFGEQSKWTDYFHVGNEAYPNGFSPFLQTTYSSSGSGPPEYAKIVAEAFGESIYSFKAERLNVGECQVGGSAILAPNAANLAEVLNVLISSNPTRYERFLAHVRTVFPHITQITVPIVAGNTARLMVWSVAAESERVDLAVPLAESGTGIGQVLAILYVVVTARAA